MLSINQISKSYGVTPVLSKISFNLNAGERIGLVGPNGCGKTTLMRILAGEESPDSGTVRRTPATLRSGYLPQGFILDPQDTLGAYLARLDGDLPALSARLEELAFAMMKDHAPALQEEYDRVLGEIEAAAEVAGRGPQVLAALGLDHLPADLPVAALSGGQKTRLALAGMLISSPQVLLLDEPTNHLDLEMLTWLEDWLAGFRGAVLVVSHDRAFLDRVATSIVEIDLYTHTARVFDGNYSDYVDSVENERERQMQAYVDQQQQIARLTRAAGEMRRRARFHKGGKADPANTDGFSAGFFADRGKESVQKAKNIERRIERLTTVDRIDRPARFWEMRIEFSDAPSSGRDVLVLTDAAVGYGDNVLVEEITLTLRYGARVALIGSNGSGKTTLVRTITGQIPPLAGTVRLGSNVIPGYMAQEQENLEANPTVLETMQALVSMNETETRSLLSKYLFKGDDVFTPVGALSYGERARLSLACQVARGVNFLILDEPINHLDIPARARFEEALRQFEGTVLAILHDRYFIERYASEIWEVRERRITTREQL